MNKLKKKEIKIDLSPEDYDGWNRYCKYHDLTYKEAIIEIVEEWNASNQVKAQVIMAELNDEFDKI